MPAKGGIPVVLIGRAPAGEEAAGSKPSEPNATTGQGARPAAAGPGDAAESTTTSKTPLILVKSPPFDSSAQQLVDSAIRNATNARLDHQGGAIILINTIGDPLIHDRVRALHKALEASGIKTIEDVSFAKNSELGTKPLIERLEANRKIALVFSVDSPSTLATREAMTKIVLKRPFILAGYAAEETYTASTQMGDFAAVAEYMPTRVVRKAISVAAALVHGHKVAPVYEVPIIVHDSPENSTTAKSPEYSRKMAQLAHN